MLLFYFTTEEEPMTSIDTTALPPLPEAPAPERLHEFSELLTALVSDLQHIDLELSALGEHGFGEAEFRRSTELHGKIERGEASDEERLEFEQLEEIHQRALAITAPLSYELAGLLGIVCYWTRRDAETLIETAN